MEQTLNGGKLDTHLDIGFGINKLRLSKLVLFKIDYLRD